MTVITLADRKAHEMYCLICDKKLVSAMKGEGGIDSRFPPCDALVWSSHGNFGSSLYDPGPEFDDQQYLEAYICDDCVTKKKDKMYTVIKNTDVKRNFVKGIHAPDSTLDKEHS